MSTELRNVPDCVAQNELTQTRFWGGKDRMTCIQVTQRKPKGEGKGASELMLFAEGQEVDEFESPLEEETV